MCNPNEHKISDFFERSGGSVAFPNSQRVRVTQTFDRPILIRKIAWRRSDSDTPYRNKFGEPRFVVFEFTFVEPARNRIHRYNTHTGAKQICERLERIEALGVLPIAGTIHLRDDGSYGIE